VVSGVGSSTASEAKDDCENDRMQQDLCDDFTPVSQSGAAASVSSYTLMLCKG